MIKLYQFAQSTWGSCRSWGQHTTNGPPNQEKSVKKNVAAIKYQNIPFKMPRLDVSGGKFYHMPATNVSISDSTQLQRQAT